MQNMHVQIELSHDSHEHDCTHLRCMKTSYKKHPDKLSYQNKLKLGRHYVIKV